MSATSKPTSKYKINLDELIEELPEPVVSHQQAWEGIPDAKDRQEQLALELF